MKRFYPLRKDGRFYQTDDHKAAGWFFPTLSLILSTWYQDLFCSVNKEARSWVVKSSYPERSDKPFFTWLGHSTFLIQIGGKNILTDPIFGNLSFIFARTMPHKIKIEDLPPIDYIILSHNHFDHMDVSSLLKIKKHNPLVKSLVPMGDKAWFDEHGFIGTSEHMWWDKINQNGLKFTFLPAKHWSQRGLFDKNKSLWGSWMVEHNDFKFYFAGDTGWDQHFATIGKAFKSIDVALMPIGPGEPREWMKHAHINAEEAGKAFLALKARLFVPMHWGTFRLGLDQFKEPVTRLKNWWLAHKNECTHKVLKIVKVGQLVECVHENIVALSRLKSKSRSKVL